MHLEYQHDESLLLNYKFLASNLTSIPIIQNFKIMHYQHTLKFASKSYFHNFFYVSAILCCFDFYDMVQVSTNTNRLIFHYIFFLDICQLVWLTDILFLLLSRPVLLLTVASKSACVGLSVSHGRECLLQPASG